jgi:hypothetical protein
MGRFKTVRDRCSIIHIGTIYVSLVIRNEFSSDINRFLATFYEVQHREQLAKPYLYIPKEIVKQSIDHLARDKPLIYRLEGTSTMNGSHLTLFLAVMLKWHQQLRDLLLFQDRLMSIENQSTGIPEEIQFWKERLAELRAIARQLTSPRVQNILQLMSRTKSNYVQPFVHIQRNIEVEQRIRESEGSHTFLVRISPSKWKTV